MRPQQQRPSDHGFSLIEMLIVIVIVGILGTVVVVAMTGLRGDAEDSACPAGLRNLNTAVESYFAQYETTSIVAADASPDGYERTLVAAGLIREPSEFYDLDDVGTITPAAGSPCAIVLS